MKKLFFVLSLSILAWACQKGEPNDPGGSESSIVKVGIKDARVIYQQSTSTKSASSGTQFMQITKNGDVKPILFVTAKGDSVALQIDDVKNLNNEYILLKGTFAVQKDQYFKCLFVNKNTEVLYGVPDEFQHIFETEHCYSDKNGNMYVSGNAICKISPIGSGDITIQRYCDGSADFVVDKDGLCNSEGNLKCPGGRIYDYRELFTNYQDKDHRLMYLGFDQSLYIPTLSMQGGTATEPSVFTWYLHKIVLDGANELHTEIVTTKTEDGGYIGLSESFENPVHKTRLFYLNGKYHEFDEKTKALIRLDVSELGDRMLSDSWCSIKQDGKQLTIRKVAYADYKETVQILQFAGYNIGSFVTSPTVADISFYGLRYIDGKNIIGTIDKDGNVTVTEDASSDYPVVKLIRIN